MDQPTPNRLSRSLAPIERLPRALRTRVRTFLIGRVVKFVGTAGLRIEEVSDRRASVVVDNRRRVRNHIGGVHAAAMVLVAESATGFVVAMNVPDSAAPVIKSMKIDFAKRARGSLRAVAELTDEQRALMHTAERGEVDVKVTVTDEAGIEPLACTMIWAWTPKP